MKGKRRTKIAAIAFAGIIAVQSIGIMNTMAYERTGEIYTFGASSGYGNFPTKIKKTSQTADMLCTGLTCTQVGYTSIASNFHAYLALYEDGEWRSRYSTQRVYTVGTYYTLPNTKATTNSKVRIMFYQPNGNYYHATVNYSIN